MSPQSKPSSNKHSDLSLESRLEALLFVAPGTVTIKQLAESLEVAPREVEKALK